MATVISIQIWVIFNKCFADDYHPVSWNLDDLIPIYKSEPEDNISSFRPISILSSLSNNCEKITKDKLFKFTSPYIIPAPQAFLTNSFSLKISVHVMRSPSNVCQISHRQILYMLMYPRSLIQSPIIICCTNYQMGTILMDLSFH